MSSHRGSTRLIIPVPPTLDRWVLEEENLPETPLHQRIVDLLVLIFTAWIARAQHNAMTGSNIALRWDRENPKRGVDPDVYLVEPAPPGGEGVTSLRLWEEGHHAPRIAVEVVSESTAAKDYDYDDGPARYAAAGVKELWVFDPLRMGPRDGGGPWALQVWRRTPKGAFRRVYQGDGPAFSRELGAWVVVTDAGTRLRIADDAAGARLWLTDAEQERAAREQERAAREQERAARELAEAELARLRATLDAAPAKGSPPRRARR